MFGYKEKDVVKIKIKHFLNKQKKGPLYYRWLFKWRRPHYFSITFQRAAPLERAVQMEGVMSVLAERNE